MFSPAPRTGKRLSSALLWGHCVRRLQTRPTSLWAATAVLSEGCQSERWDRYVRGVGAYRTRVDFAMPFLVEFPPSSNFEARIMSLPSPCLHPRIPLSQYPSPAQSFLILEGETPRAFARPFVSLGGRCSVPSLSPLPCLPLLLVWTLDFGRIPVHANPAGEGKLNAVALFGATRVSTPEIQIQIQIQARSIAEEILETKHAFRYLATIQCYGYTISLIQFPRRTGRLQSYSGIDWGLMAWPFGT
ncbi:hypothetical protein B0H14DRAFT_3447308 [Mycena olivaceomarginata]|nr:hypothetical protein B0H14DRAFT_3447308 [Mycena olivaceomarginata]